MTDKPKILAVDDDPAILELISSVLEEAFDIVCATDGQEAIERAVEERPDIVLLDLMMPKVDGFTVARELRERGLNDVTVIVLTAYQGLRQRAEQHDFDGYLIKPFESTVLVEQIRNALEDRDRHSARVPKTGNGPAPSR